MLNDAFVAFWTGMGAGAVIGIIIAAVLTAISNSIENKNMPNRRAIEVIADELHHCELHIQDAGKSPEYYQEMQELIDSYHVAIDAMQAVGGDNK